jgi:hypothetical protein
MTGTWERADALNVTVPFDGILESKRCLLHDPDPLCTAEFFTILQGVGVKSVRLPPRSPNLNAHAERFVRSIHGVLLGPDDSVWRDVAQDGHSKFRGALQVRF